MIVSLALPPSANNLYANTPRGRVLTREGRDYKLDVQKRLMRSSARTLAPEPPYTLRAWLLVPDRRRRDNTNALKVVEDAIAEYLGYDDSRNLAVTIYKALDRSDPRLVVELTHKAEPIPAPPDKIPSRAHDMIERGSAIGTA